MDLARQQAEKIRLDAEREVEEARREAEQARREAEQTRREAVASADRVFQQIAALERPLAELVGSLRLESDRVQGEMDSHVDAEAVVIGAESEGLKDEPETVDAEVEVEAPDTAAEPEPAEPAPWDGPEEAAADTEAEGEAEPEAPKRKLFSRLRPGGPKLPFIDTPGHCAVCQKTFEAGDEETLRRSGWKVNDDVGLCPEDQAQGWQLPEGARLPFRRGGD